MNLRSFRFSFLAILLAFGFIPLLAAQTVAQETGAKHIAAATIPSQNLLQPSELAQMLQTPQKPLVLQVGSHVLYAEAHIPGSEYVGAAGTPAGIQALRERVSSLKKDQLIVIYCGCCPWGKCPNMGPAFEQLHALGFTNVKALYIADNFGTDWVDKGLPVAKGR
ncbi:MAG: rhodanese-like domain-containing protein [Granulicella sp.]